MIKAVFILLSLGLAVGCLLALDDITTGSEPSYAAEWTMVAATGIWFGALAWRRRGRS